MEKLLNPTAARNVFGHSQTARNFMKMGGVNYISTGSVKDTDANAFAIAGLEEAKGSKHWAAELAHCANGAEIMRNANKELLGGEKISSAEMAVVNPEQALAIVEKAEQQIENNQLAAQIQKRNSLAR